MIYYFLFSAIFFGIGFGITKGKRDKMPSKGLQAGILLGAFVLISSIALTVGSSDLGDAVWRGAWMSLYIGLIFLGGYAGRIWKRKSPNGRNGSPNSHAR